MKGRALISAACLLALALALVAPAFSHLPQFTPPAGGGTPQPDHWDFSAFPVMWNLNPATNSNITGSRSVADVIQASFNTWLAAPNTTLQVSRCPDIGDTSAGFNQGAS